MGTCWKVGPCYATVANDGWKWYAEYVRVVIMLGKSSSLYVCVGAKIFYGTIDYLGIFIVTCVQYTVIFFDTETF